MLMPSIFGESLLDDLIGYPFGNSETADLMRTDVKDTDQGYEVMMNLPGVKKEDIKAELKDGYLTIRAAGSQDRDEKDENGHYIRRERRSGSCSRSFYVGDAVTQEDIKAKYENGILKLSIPKKEESPAVEKKDYIAIEG